MPPGKPASTGDAPGISTVSVDNSVGNGEGAAAIPGGGAGRLLQLAQCLEKSSCESTACIVMTVF
jgi:hypothetical protein